jgi:hypothetical protein
MFNAAGGYNTLYFTILCGTLGYTFNGVTRSELVPAGQTFISKAGFMTYMSRAGKYVLLPAVVGYTVGITIFGDANEL